MTSPAQKNLYELLDILSVSALVAAKTMADAMMDGAIIKAQKTALDVMLALITAEAIAMKVAMMVEALHHLTHKQWWIYSSSVLLYAGFCPCDCV
jgi:hypothetical protein